ncbi:hypothetical protein BH20ACI2_BH20ACI2_00620 [soil metagenome]
MSKNFARSENERTLILENRPSLVKLNIIFDLRNKSIAPFGIGEHLLVLFDPGEYYTFDGKFLGHSGEVSPEPKMKVQTLTGTTPERIYFLRTAHQYGATGMVRFVLRGKKSVTLDVRDE